MHLNFNSTDMLHWMCAVKPTDVINTQDLRLRLGIDDLDLPSDGSVLDGLAMSSGAHHGLEGFLPWMLVGVGPVAGQDRPGVRS